MNMGDSVINRAINHFIPFRPKLLKFLLENGANPNSSPGTWFMRVGPPLLELSKIKTTDDVLKAVPLLVHHGAEANILREVIPYRKCSVDFLRALITLGADVNAKHQFDDSTPLHAAALYGDSEVAHLLLANGVDVHHLKSEGFSAADTAFQAGHIDTARIIVKREFIDAQRTLDASNELFFWLRQQRMHDELRQKKGKFPALDLEFQLPEPHKYFDNSIPVAEALVAKRFPEPSLL